MQQTDATNLNWQLAALANSKQDRCFSWTFTATLKCLTLAFTQYKATSTPLHSLLLDHEQARLATFYTLKQCRCSHGSAGSNGKILSNFMQRNMYNQSLVTS
jgi:hypothetical protein